MEINKILVTLAGIALSLGIYIFFLKKSDKIVESDADVFIMVDGGYKPDIIQVPINKTIRLHFLRKDPSSCLEEVVLPDFGKKEYLELNKEKIIEIEPIKPGTYEISCGMNMFHGKIIVKG